MEPQTESAKPLIHGISLEQFAGVMAAVAERIALAEVLAQEGIDAASWAWAERAWRAEIAESTALQVELIQKRRQAEECLGRRIDPLEEDASAWMGVLGALATSEQPNGVVEQLGLTMGDIARLGRHWKRRAESDAGLAKRLEELAPTAKPPAKVAVAPAKLQPFPWTIQRAQGSAGSSPIGESGSAAKASLEAAPLEPVVRERQLATYQLRELRARAPVDVAPPPVAMAPPPPIGSGTAAVDLRAVQEGLALAAAKRASAVASAPPARAASAPAPRVGTGTEAVDVSVVEQGIALAAARRASELGQPRVGSGTVFAPEPATTTPAVPFKAPSSTSPLSAAATTPEIARVPTGTLLAPPDAALDDGVPFASPQHAGGQRGASTPAPPREMSLEQYAYVQSVLRGAADAELPAALARFNLTPETRAQLEAAWAARMRADRSLAIRYAVALSDHKKR